MLWGLHHIVTPFLVAPSERLAVALNVSNGLIYYLVVFPIIIVVLDRARSKAAGLKEFNERLIDGLGEGLQLVDDRREGRLRRIPGSPILDAGERPPAARC